MSGIPGVTTHELWIASDLEEIEKVHAGVCDRLATSNCTALDNLAARLAIEEALVNAITHGNQQHPKRQVHVVYWVDHEHVGVRIEDEGDGFEVASIPAHPSYAWHDEPKGRGLSIMKRFMHEVAYERGGCVVTMKRYFDQ